MKKGFGSTRPRPRAVFPARRFIRTKAAVSSETFQSRGEAIAVRRVIRVETRREALALASGARCRRRSQFFWIFSHPIHKQPPPTPRYQKKTKTALVPGLTSPPLHPISWSGPLTPPRSSPATARRQGGKKDGCHCPTAPPATDGPGVAAGGRGGIAARGGVITAASSTAVDAAAHGADAQDPAA